VVRRWKRSLPAVMVEIVEPAAPPST